MIFSASPDEESLIDEIAEFCYQMIKRSPLRVEIKAFKAELRARSVERSSESLDGSPVMPREKDDSVQKKELEGLDS